ncbi:MAG: alpha/beta hydrolase fold domain-containing protein [Isosphaeraceae bacterium]
MMTRRGIAGWTIAVVVWQVPSGLSPRSADRREVAYVAGGRPGNGWTSTRRPRGRSTRSSSGSTAAAGRSATRRICTRPSALNAKGYVLVSVNYRLHPEADFKAQAGDIARAVRWVREHAGEFGGDPDRIVLMGHSAGAHLAALVGIDGRYLQAEGLSPRNLSGVILLDGAGYDIPAQIEQAPLPRMKTLYTTVFGDDPAGQEGVAVRQVARDQGIPVPDPPSPAAAIRSAPVRGAGPGTATRGSRPGWSPPRARRTPRSTANSATPATRPPRRSSVPPGTAGSPASR